MKSGSVGRADLLDAYWAGGPELQSAVARLLGLEIVVPKPTVPAPEDRPAPAAPVNEPSAPTVAVGPIAFWQAESYTRIEPPRAVDEHEPFDIPSPDEPATDRTQPAPLAFRPLATSAAMLTKLRRVAPFTRISGELDSARVLDHLSRGLFPRSWPRLIRKAWGQSLHVILDNQEHLKPYRLDQQAALEALRRVYPHNGVDVVELDDGAARPRRPLTPRSATYQPPEGDATILALTDLGVLAQGTDQRREPWLELGKLYRERGARPVALIPCEPNCVPPELTRHWIVIPWESRIGSRTAGLSPDEVKQTCRRILTLLSYALRIEPILIREVRRLLVKGGLGAGLEARVWQDPALRGHVYEVAEFDPEEARQLQANFHHETPGIREDVISLIRRCHLHDYEFVWFLERLGLEAETKKLGFADSDLGAAVRWVRRLSVEFQGDARKRDPMSDESLWFRPRLHQDARVAVERKGRRCPAQYLGADQRDQGSTPYRSGPCPRSLARKIDPNLGSRPGGRSPVRAAPQGWRRRNARFRKFARTDARSSRFAQDRASRRLPGRRHCTGVGRRLGKR